MRTQRVGVVPEKIHPYPHTGIFCCLEREGEEYLFAIIVNLCIRKSKTDRQVNFQFSLWWKHAKWSFHK
jgi:hypothetical protein